MRPNDPGEANSGGSRPSNPLRDVDAGGEPMRNRMDDEHVAALHDGRLDERERDELYSRLLADDDELDVFAETAGVLRELEEARGAVPPTTAVATDSRTLGTRAPSLEAAAPDAGGVIPLSTRRPASSNAVDTVDTTAAAEDADDGVIPIRSRRAPGRRWMTYGAIAASVVGVGLAAALLARGGDGRLDDPVSAVAMLEGGAAPGPAAGWDESWSRFRGAPDAAIDPAAVRIGAHLVDLELADASRDTAAVHTLGGDVAALLGNMRGGAGAAAIYRKVQQASPDSVAPLLAQGREEVRTLLGSVDGLELGIWAETGRTAAARRDTAFFRRSETRAVMERLAASPEFDEETVAALGAVRDAIPEQGQVDMAALQQRLSTLLRIAGQKRSGA
ncbi:MAG TPA: hypothetical protein VEX86_10865 [Longimicrobium sp.]|nr:hypothetical protein [Longimicrobium sp.]